MRNALSELDGYETNNEPAESGVTEQAALKAQAAAPKAAASMSSNEARMAAADFAARALASRADAAQGEGSTAAIDDAAATRPSPANSPRVAAILSPRSR